MKTHYRNINQFYSEVQVEDGPGRIEIAQVWSEGDDFAADLGRLNMSKQVAARSYAAQTGGSPNASGDVFGALETKKVRDHLTDICAVFDSKSRKGRAETAIVLLRRGFTQNYFAVVTSDHAYTARDRQWPSGDHEVIAWTWPKGGMDRLGRDLRGVAY